MPRTVLQIPANPDHIRTARLVAAAAARQAELDEEQVESIALATNEACVLALGELAAGQELSIAMEPEESNFVVGVLVVDVESDSDQRGTSEAAQPGAPAVDSQDAIDPLSNRELTMSIIRAVAPEVVVEDSTVGFAMRMAWPRQI